MRLISNRTSSSSKQSFSKELSDLSKLLHSSKRQPESTTTLRSVARISRQDTAPSVIAASSSMIGLTMQAVISSTSNSRRSRQSASRSSRMAPLLKPKRTPRALTLRASPSCARSVRKTSMSPYGQAAATISATTARSNTTRNKRHVPSAANLVMEYSTLRKTLQRG